MRLYALSPSKSQMATRFTFSLGTADSCLGPFPPKSESFLSVLMHSSINAQKNYITDNYHCCHTLEFYPVVYLVFVSWVLSREQWAWKLSRSDSVLFCVCSKNRMNTRALSNLHGLPVFAHIPLHVLLLPPIREET